MRYTGESRPLVRANVPPEQPEMEPAEFYKLRAQGQLLGAALVFVLLVLALAFAAWLTPSSAPATGPVQTPTTYGYPSYGQVPDPGVRPTPAVVR